MTDQPFIDGDIDDIIRSLEDKMVRTASGSYIKVDDLRDVQRQVREARMRDQGREKPKTFPQARLMAMKDPSLQTEPVPPPAPAFSRVSGVMQKE